MKWIWMRHGETKENRERRYLGHYDAPLSASGRQQVEEAAALLGSEQITRVYTSDLLRCVETAAIMTAARQVVPVKIRELRELDFGHWDCNTYEEIMNDDPERAKSWYNNPYTTAPPGGETLSMLGDRVDRFLRTLSLDMQTDETALLVSHGGPIRWFQAAWMTDKIEPFWQMLGVAPAGFFAVRYNGDRWSR
ncbi:alpha-ribazole phosphatase [Aneurinibacillus soli]|uniref:Phosphoserine phosphatase 1 n=1 Tax=Aneurinibacillus soli TaxID=1500254 RepID=A0A0U5AWX3_9BACL|nr:histidine phosphatase family protein [Aneurinibacillus soli]PYE59288.1 alpha-ribazole phosphatase [Aneurinibacillus soli]BAU26722.1 Phosphoserine phosphatase 1 [Aneurinibacillus soli]